jgi:3,4-dihydroxy 2-butanone 4-phosphate synthase/GTP cyclohydrolase II
MNENATAYDLVKPGHIFPLHAKEGGVFERQGHTEGAVDIVRLAGFKPAAVLCEIMNADGTMAQGEQLIAFATQHQLNCLSIDDIITYRLYHENMIADETSSLFTLEKYGLFKISVIKETISNREHVILSKEGTHTDKPTLVRIHSSCLTGDLFSSMRCDCHQQLHYSLKKISLEGGMLIYLNQEGRGIGLFNKIKAYALQEQGLDTVEANQHLGLPIDSRTYYLAANILRQRGIQHVRLLTNNPEKINDLAKYGIAHVERESMPSFHHEHNQFYLSTKKEKLNHVIQFDAVADAIRKSS